MKSIQAKIPWDKPEGLSAKETCTIKDSNTMSNVLVISIITAVTRLKDQILAFLDHTNIKSQLLANDFNEIGEVREYKIDSALPTN